MKRVLLISLSLVLALVGLSAVGADDGFYVVPTMKGNYAPVPKTGQTYAYAPTDDGDKEKGVAWPTPRFTDNNNGTVTDNFTGLIWLKNANAFGQRTWIQALSDVNSLHEGSVVAKNLTDGSQTGDWRLPNVRELQSLIDYGFFNPALSNTQGTGKWVEGDPFQGVQLSYYWSSTTVDTQTSLAWGVDPGTGGLGHGGKTAVNLSVWCVRGGR